MRFWTQLLAAGAVTLLIGPVHAAEDAEPGAANPPAERETASEPEETRSPAISLPDLEEMLAERSLGDPDAPVTMIEYSSLTCGHCAAFHRDTLPRIKNKYIDTGKVHFIYRDFPLDTAALAAAMLARCVPEKRYFPFLETLFREQGDWARSEDLLDELATLAKDAGLSDAAVRACLAKGRLMTGLRERALEARDEYGITSTPTLIIDGEVLAGALPFERFEEVIQEKLGEDGKATDRAPVSGGQAAVPSGSR